jgi:hypothetical protein
MIYCEISFEMSPLYFGLDVFCIFEARVPEFSTVYTAPPAHAVLWEKFRVLITRLQPQICRQNTSDPKYNDDITLLIYETTHNLC